GGSGMTNDGRDVGGTARASCVGAAVIFFFFQAEDGIRDLYVTGVQTCALPICLRPRAEGREDEGENGCHPESAQRDEGPVAGTRDRKSVGVGKECRSRWSRDH